MKNPKIPKFKNEDAERALFQKHLLSASQRYMSTASALEIYAVMLKRKGPASLSRVKEFFKVAKIELIAFDDEQLDIVFPTHWPSHTKCLCCAKEMILSKRI